MAALLLWPRPQARGLARLLAHAQLLQSFAGSPERPVPLLWQQRLGPQAAERIWRRQQGPWWQFWGSHGDVGAYLVLPARALASIEPARLPVLPLPLDDLVVLAPDALSRKLVLDQIVTPSRAQRGLEQRCLQRLSRPQAVYWSPAGLGSLAGSLTPLLTPLQEGCFSMARQGSGLDLVGEVAASAGVLGSSPGQQPELLDATLAPGVLLELRGPSLKPLLQGLLGRQLIRQPLAARYGIAEPQLRLLSQLPFVLRLRALPQGPFRASLELELAVGRQRTAWIQVLNGLRQPLLEQGLVEPPPRLQATSARPSNGALPTARWSREDGEVVGGWTWITPVTQKRDAEPRLVIFLGPQPQPSALGAGDAGGSEASSTAPLRLIARPGAMHQLELWPRAFPELVGQSTLLEMALSGGAQEPLSLLRGRLLPSRTQARPPQ